MFHIIYIDNNLVWNRDDKGFAYYDPTAAAVPDRPDTGQTVRYRKEHIEITFVQAYQLFLTDRETSYICGGGNIEMFRLLLGHYAYDMTKMYLHLAQQSQLLYYGIYRLDPVFFRTY